MVVVTWPLCLRLFVLSFGVLVTAKEFCGSSNPHLYLGMAPELSNVCDDKYYITAWSHETIVAWWHCALSISLEAFLKVRINSLSHNSRLVQLNVTTTRQGVGAPLSTGEVWYQDLLVGLKGTALKRLKHLGLWK